LPIARAALLPAGTDRELNDNVNLPADLLPADLNDQTVRRNLPGLSFQGLLAERPLQATVGIHA
jgi:hypothetical protein